MVINKTVRLKVAALLYLTIGFITLINAQEKNNLQLNKTKNMMTQKEVIIAYAEALGKGDIPTAFSFFSEKIKWHQPGKNKFSGIKNGADEIGQILGGMVEDTKRTFAVKPNGNIQVNGNLVVMPVRFSGSIDGRSIDMTGIDLFKVKDGKIVEVWLFSEDQEVEDDFWGK